MIKLTAEIWREKFVAEFQARPIVSNLEGNSVLAHAVDDGVSAQQQTRSIPSL